jgi:hypothetical protein
LANLSIFYTFKVVAGCDAKKGFWAMKCPAKNYSGEELSDEELSGQRTLRFIGKNWTKNYPAKNCLAKKLPNEEYLGRSTLRRRIICFTGKKFWEKN